MAQPLGDHREWYPVGEHVGTVGVTQEVERGPFRFGNFEPFKQSRYGSGNGIRPERRSIRICKDEVKVRSVVRAVFLTVHRLLLTVNLYRGEGFGWQPIPYASVPAFGCSHRACSSHERGARLALRSPALGLSARGGSSNPILVSARSSRSACSAVSRSESRSKDKSYR
jgi:hypothetical protein